LIPFFFADEPAQPVELGAVEIGCRHAADKDLDHLLRRGAVEERLDGGAVELELVGHAAMGKGMDHQPAVRAAQHLGLPRTVVDTFERVGEGRVDKLLGVGEDVGDGAAGELRIVKGEIEIGQQHAAALALDNMPGAHRRDAAGREPLRLLGDETGPRLGDLWTEPDLFAGAQLRHLGGFDKRQRRTALDRVEHAAAFDDRLAACEILRQWRFEPRRTFEHQPLGRADRSIDDAAFEQLPGAADHQPAQPREPAALMQIAQEPRDVGAVADDDVDVRAAALGEPSPGVAVKQPGAGRGPLETRRLGEIGHH